MAVPFFDDDPEDYYDVQQQPHHQNVPLQNHENVPPDEHDPPSGRVDVSDVSYACNEDDGC